MTRLGSVTVGIAGEGWRVTLYQPGKLPFDRTFAERGHPVLVASQASALRDLPLLDLSAEEAGQGPARRTGSSSPVIRPA